ncbi:MAG: 4-hydroxythreonine-4-phosphate dehydrogenase PdxA [Alphaproteobacteria bacterium]|nr:4-hydroxythreonine-4-phosphate dehydrogenase PdxA [Alphaproteobacteria bacterium]
MTPSDLKHRPPLALTMGDPAGIGLEISLAAWTQRNDRYIAPFALFADADALIARASHLALSIPVHIISDIAEANQIFPVALPVVHTPLRANAVPGDPDTANAGAILASIEHAVAAVAQKTASAVVTNPIAKSILYAAGFKHPGHTEYLASLSELHQPGAQRTPVMMLACDELRVVPVTIHIPLNEVSTALTAEKIVSTSRIVARDLQTSFAISNPRIWLTGLNPHAGENATLGDEETTIIEPAIAQLQKLGIDVSGPFPADTMFHEHARQSYDAAIAMYHDQALIPIKTIAFDRGVNTTLGLPFVRTSPDHGTAFDIAGKGIASAESLIAALNLAHQMATTRARTAIS